MRPSGTLVRQRAEGAAVVEELGSREGKRLQESARKCRLYVAYEISAAFPRFLPEDWRKIRVSRGFQRYFR
jgi:hypothetical protein